MALMNIISSVKVSKHIRDTQVIPVCVGWGWGCSPKNFKLKFLVCGHVTSSLDHTTPQANFHCKTLLISCNSSVGWYVTP